MTLQEAYNFFKSLSSQTTNKSEVKIYNKFLSILSNLKSRTFTQEEMQSIEAELDALNLITNKENNIKFFKKAFSKFQNFLRDTFSLIPKGFYTRLGIGLGMSFGIIFGIVFLSSFERSLGIAFGVIIGLLVGLTFGQSMDSKARSESRVL